MRLAAKCGERKYVTVEKYGAGSLYRFKNFKN